MARRCCTGGGRCSYQAAGSSRTTTGGSSEELAIIISGSLETGSNDRLDIGDDVLGEAVQAPTALQTILPAAQVGSQPGKSEFNRIGLKRPKLPDWIITNSYLPACGPAPPKEEVSTWGWKMLNASSVVRRLLTGANPRLIV